MLGRVTSGSAVVLVLALGSATGCGSNRSDQTYGASGSSGDGAGGHAAAGRGATTTGGTVSATGGAATGGVATGDATGGTGATAGSPAGGTGGSLPHVVSPCPTDNEPGLIGVWQNVTPAGLAQKAGQYGSQGVVVNPQDPATVFVGSDFGGLYKSTDCGATWTQIATGRNGDTQYNSVSAGENWSIAIDPVDPNVLYTVAGYGSQGLWKTTDGGTDWDQLFPPDSEVAQSVDGDFASIVSMDPHDHLHLVVAFHNNCKGAYADHCQAETKDAGKTWRLIKVPGGGEGSGPIVIDATTWIFGSYDGLWRTSDSGATWKIVYGEHYHHYLMHTDKNGNYYVGCSGGVITSSGDASVWKPIPNSGNNLQGITGDGRSIFASQQFSPGKYFSASEADPMSWKEIPNTGGSWGAYYMAGDRDHHIIYGSEMGDGLWRMVTY